MINGMISFARRPSLPLLLLIFLALHGCAVQVPTPRPEPPAPIERPEPPTPPIGIPETPVPTQPPTSIQKGPAQSLFAQAESARQSRQPGQAEILLERALRIEPRNAQYWHTLGQIKYDQGDFGQAVQFCLKSDSLARNNNELRQSNRNLLEQAYRKLGDTEKAEKLSQ